MKMIMLASAIALGLSTGGAFAATSSNDDAVTTRNQAGDVHTAQQFDSVGTVSTGRTGFATPSWSNPTGRIESNGTISLYPPDSIGGGR